MVLVETETVGYVRDTTNMSLINTNKKAYDIYKAQKKIQSQKQSEINDLKNELNSLKELLKSVIESKS